MSDIPTYNVTPKPKFFNGQIEVAITGIFDRYQNFFQCLSSDHCGSARVSLCFISHFG